MFLLLYTLGGSTPSSVRVLAIIDAVIPFNLILNILLTILAGYSSITNPYLLFSSLFYPYDTVLPTNKPCFNLFCLILLIFLDVSFKYISFITV